MKQLSFVLLDNPSFEAQKERYEKVCLDSHAVVEAWRRSLFSHEWLYPDGRFRVHADMKESLRLQRVALEAAIKAGKPLDRPLLGLGLIDGVEIAYARAEFLTLAALGVARIEVYIPCADRNVFTTMLRQDL